MPDSRSSWSSPLDTAAITTPAIAERRQPVLRVVHDEGHGGWQFYDDVEPLTGPVVLPKAVFLDLDPSLTDITDLPVGWEAVRETQDGPWSRSAI
jgi:hypothetical protein